MNDELRAKLNKIFSDDIQGGCTNDMESILDRAIEDGELDADEVRANEMAIAYFFDDHWFTCVGCGWTMPIDCLSDGDHVDLICSDCGDE